MYKDVLYGIAYGCPALRRSKGCPFKAIDHLPFTEKVKYINKLLPHQLIMINEYHSACSMQRHLSQTNCCSGREVLLTDCNEKSNIL